MNRPARDQVYDIHGLVQVIAEASLGQRVMHSLNTQIGYFLVEGPADEVPYRLRLKPYKGFPRIDLSHRLQTNLGVSDTPYGIDFESEGWALQLSEREITLYLSDTTPPVNPYIQLLLSQQGVSLIHSAALEREGRVYLFPGFGGVGKTALAAKMVRHGGFRFMGDDVVPVKADGTCLAFPRRLMLFPYHREVFPDYFSGKAAALWLTRVSASGKRLLNRNVPFKALIKRAASRMGVSGWLRSVISAPDYTAAVAPEEMFGAAAMASEGRIDRLVFIQRYGGETLDLKPIAHSDMAEILVAIMHHEWLGHWAPITLAAGAGKFELNKYYARTAETVERAIAGLPISRLLIPYRATADQVADRVEVILDGDQ